MAMRMVLANKINSYVIRVLGIRVPVGTRGRVSDGPRSKTVDMCIVTISAVRAILNLLRYHIWQQVDSCTLNSNWDSID